MVKLKHLEKVIIGEIPNNEIHAACMLSLRNKKYSYGFAPDFKFISLISNHKQDNLYFYIHCLGNSYQNLLYSCKVFCSFNHLLNKNAERSKIKSIFSKTNKQASLDTNLPKLMFKMLVKKIETMAVEMFHCGEIKLMIVFLFYVAISKTLRDKTKDKKKSSYILEPQFGQLDS